MPSSEHGNKEKELENVYESFKDSLSSTVIRQITLSLSVRVTELQCQLNVALYQASSLTLRHGVQDIGT